jgi:uncharacterized membrane protein YGL010W
MKWVQKEDDMDEISKKPVEILIEQYAESHQHPTNERIHCIRVPAIVWALFKLLKFNAFQKHN